MKRRDFFVGGKISSQEDEEEEESAKMNDSEVSKQVQQMVHFIKQEAEEKANEISVAAEEEFNIEKLQLVEAEKKKIKQEYERKEKQVDVRKKNRVFHTAECIAFEGIASTG